MKKLLMGIALAAMASSASAQMFNDLSDEKECVVVTNWEDGTSLFVMQDQAKFEKGHVSLIFTNDNWTIKPKANLGRITIESASGRKLVVDGWGLDSTSFLVPVLYKDVYALFGTERFTVYKGTVEIGAYSSTPVSDALVSFMRCHNRFEEWKAERERKEYLSKLPKNPFAE